MKNNNGDIEAQTGEIDELKTMTSELSAEVKDLTAQHAETKGNNKEAENKYRKLAKANLALKAKLEFYNTHTDYPKKVRALSIEDFRNLINTNELVNTSIERMVDKLGTIKAEADREFDI